MSLKPRIVESERYALAVPIEDCQDTILSMLQTYHDLEQLETGYDDWRTLCKREGLTIPLPIERLDAEGNYRILTDMIKED